MKSKKISFLFLFSSLVILIAGLAFGVVGGLQYVLPDFFKEYLPFQKTRPLHVTLVTYWIISGAVGGIYYYLPIATGSKLFSAKLGIAHFILFIGTIFTIIVCYLINQFGGREYLEYPPVLAVSILIAWLLFGINYLFTVKKMNGKWPVYIWMWSTGVLFFFITYLESYLWMIPFFRDNVVRDITVQWKSLGSMVGAWNMLIYGSAFFIMEQVSGDMSLSKSRLSFFFYFLGLTNLMFNWGHHTYIVPAAPYIKNISYVVSMTELLILGNIILNWRKSVKMAVKNYYSISYRFLIASDIWIFLNLILAIIISIPWINFYTHGTHITVAHAMGATIGINSMILFASISFILNREDDVYLSEHKTIMSFGFYLFNISLFLFWTSLLVAGIYKSVKMSPGDTSNFLTVMDNLAPVFRVFSLVGIIVFISIMILGYFAGGKLLKAIISADKDKL